MFAFGHLRLEIPLDAISWRQSLSDGILRQIVPHFDLVSIGIGKEHVRLSRAELSAMQDLPARSLNCRGGPIDVPRIGELKAEMLDAARFPDVLRSFLEHENVARSGSLGLKEVLVTIDGHHAEDIVVELERSLEIAYSEGEMGKAERLDHSSRCLALPIACSKLKGGGVTFQGEDAQSRLSIAAVVNCRHPKGGLG